MYKSLGGKSSQRQKPSHWPQQLQYIQSYHYHSSVPSPIRQLIQGSTVTRGETPVSYRCVVVIRRISDTSHPALGQYGLFSARKIPPRTRILDYIGEIHCDDRPDSDYDLSLHRTQDGINVGVDASSMGNEARFINDYRGVSKKPNAMFNDTRLTSGELRMSVWSLDEEIKKGEEILVSYGKSWWRARGGMNEGIESVVDT